MLIKFVQFRQKHGDGSNDVRLRRVPKQVCMDVSEESGMRQAFSTEQVLQNATSVAITTPHCENQF